MIKLYNDEEGIVIIVGDLNATHREWNNESKSRGTTVLKVARQRNYKISPPEKEPYKVTGRCGEGKPDLLLDLEGAQGLQLSSTKWENS